MNNEKHGILKSFFRFLGCWNWEEARTMEPDPKEALKGKEEGIAAAFDIQHQKMMGHYEDLQDAIKKVEAILEEKKAQLSNAPDEKTRAEISLAIEKISQSLGPYREQLKEFKAEIDNMPLQKDKALADFAEAQKIVNEQ